MKNVIHSYIHAISIAYIGKYYVIPINYIFKITFTDLSHITVLVTI
jgi:hypothetical protein